MDLFACNINNELGWAYMNAINVSGLYGDVIPVYLSFTAIGETNDTCRLNITDANLITADYQSIPYNVHNGSFTITPSRTVVSIEDIIASPGDIITSPIMVRNVDDLGSGVIAISYDPMVVHVINVTSGNGNALMVQDWNADNSIGNVLVVAWDADSQHSGNVIYSNITYQGVGSEESSTSLNLSVMDLTEYHNYTQIVHTVSNGSFTIGDVTPPVILEANATPCVILNDNGRPRPPGTNISRLNVSVVDTDTGISTVTINLSVLGGSPVQSMVNIPDTDIWTVNTNAITGINQTNKLVVTVTDKAGNSNTSVIHLTVLLRGDVVRDGQINLEDAHYIAEYLVGNESKPLMLVADIIPAKGDGILSSGDALYIEKYLIGNEVAP